LVLLPLITCLLVPGPLLHFFFSLVWSYHLSFAFWSGHLCLLWSGHPCLFWSGHPFVSSGLVAFLSSLVWSPFCLLWSGHLFVSSGLVALLSPLPLFDLIILFWSGYFSLSLSGLISLVRRTCGILKAKCLAYR